MQYHVTQKPAIRKFYLFCLGAIFYLLAVSATSLLFSHKVHASHSTYHNAYEKMDNKLPDDDYTLYKSGSPVSSSEDCGAKWGCTTGNYSYFVDDPNATSHQYITLGNRSINDDPSVPAADAYKYANTTELVMYTWGKPQSPREFRMSVVDRGIGAPLACKNTVTAFYYHGETEIEVGKSEKKTTNCEAVNFADVPIDAFAEMTIPRTTTGSGIWRAKIVLFYGSANGQDGNLANTQTSFHVSTSFAKLGYYGSDPKLDMSKGAEHRWVNVYPTNYARKSKIRFYFRPACSVKAGTQFSIEWDDVNNGNSSIQPEAATATVYKYEPGKISTRTVVRPYNGLGGGYGSRTEEVEHYGSKQPYAYMVEFEGIYGGNGISFRHPFNSSDARVECPPAPVTAGGTCTSYQYTDPGTEVPSGGTQARRTNTLVKIVDNRGKVLVNEGVSYTGPNTGGYLGENEEGTWSYQPTGDKITITIQRKYKVLDTNSNEFYTTQTKETRTITCYKPSCNLSASGTGPGGIVVAGGNIRITGTITEAARDASNPDLIDIPESPDGSRFLSLTSSTGEHRLGDDAYASGQPSLPISWDVNANGSRSTQTISAYVDFYGIGGLPVNDPSTATDETAVCSVTVIVYEPFNINPSASLTGTNWENPNPINYQTCGNKTQGPDVSATASSWLTYTGTGTVHSASATHTYGYNVCDTYAYSPTVSPVAGQEYCPHVTINPASGYVGPNGELAGTQPATADGACERVHNKPYVHFFGSDVFAGGGFGDDCTVTNAGINTYLNTTTSNGGGQPTGSGVQIGALSINAVNGFNSALLRSVAPSGSNGLMFSNTDPSSPGSGPGAPAVGGNMGGEKCATDYFAKMPAGTASEAGSVYVVPSSNGQNVKYFDHNIEVKSGEVRSGLQAVVYVRGNVHISGDGIRFKDSTWAKIEDIPSFYLVVKGNIFIDRTVTRLDGFYIAQPDGGTGGNIYTCTNGTNPYDSPAELDSLLNDCRSQLVVNGSFVANHLYLDRSYGSLRSSFAGERLDFTSKPCGDSGTTTLGDCAAEIFNYSPDLYLGRTALPASTGPTTGKYDFITSLSPVL